MTIAFHDNKSGKNKYKCDVCGHIDFWQPGFSTYSSIILEEGCPGELPTACNEQCGAIMLAKIKSGEWKLPEVQSSWHSFRITKPREGY